MFQLSTGKNPKWTYYLRNFLLQLVPKVFFVQWRKTLLKNLHLREDYEYIQQRVDYYCKLQQKQQLSKAIQLSNFRLSKVKEGSVYFWDTIYYLKAFPSKFHFSSLFGDIVHVPEQASIVKSRPINLENENSVLLKLDKVRHFIFLKDKIKFAAKKNILLFRGKIKDKSNRELFFEQYFDHPKCDLGMIDKDLNHLPNAWRVPKLSLYKHLDYKFILALEGIDVASNLKWIMSTNSIAVMPKPSCETWFMEGQLEAGKHYIEIKDDYSDLIEQLDYYNNRPELCEEIIANANAYVAQFKNKKREHIISLLVLQKYFTYTSYSS